MKQVVEIKQHLDGRMERFKCDVVALTPHQAILRYVGHRARPLRDGPLYLPAGKILTVAFYWEGRNYLIYKLMLSNGKLLGHRFDICDDVRISQETIHWKDLVLDLWVDPSRQIYVLDDDELEECKIRGLLSTRQLKIIQETKVFLLGHYREVLDEIARISP